MKTLLRSVLLLTFVLPAGARAAETFDPAARAKAVAPYIEEQTLAVLHVDLARVKLDPLFAEVAKILPEDAKPVLTETKENAQVLLKILVDSGAKDVYVLITLAGFGHEHDVPFVVLPIGEGANEEALTKVLKQLDSRTFAQSKRIGSVLVVGSPATIDRLASLKPDPRPELEKALAAAGDTTAQAVFLPPKYGRRVLAEIMPTLPKDLGGGPSSVLSQGVLWAAAGVEVSPELAARVVIQSQDAPSAEALLAFLKTGAELLARQKEVARDVPNAAEILEALMPQPQGDQLVLALDEKNQGPAKLAALVKPPIEAARTAARRAQAMNHLKQFGLAMHNYHDAKKSFPPAASRSTEGKPLLSWRVHILPYIEEGGLYKQFHLDEPWDSPHNKTLLARMPAIFRSPASKLDKPGYTNYVVPTGPGTVFEGPEGTKLQDITDGTSNTIMILEVGDEAAVPWTKPEDWTLDPQKPTRGLGGLYPGAFNAAWCDGSVRSLSLEIDPETLRLLLLRNDGKPVNAP